MSDNAKSNFEEVDKDLSTSWLELSDNVRDLAADLKLKTAGSQFAAETDHLSQQTARLCDHVAKLHSDVIDLVENMETHIPLPESDSEKERRIADMDEVDKEKIQIQRESHELRDNFKDVLKALFMWVDDPKDRIRKKP